MRVIVGLQTRFTPEGELDDKLDAAADGDPATETG